MKNGNKLLSGVLALTSTAVCASALESEFQIGKPAEMKPVTFQADYSLGILRNDNGLEKTKDHTPDADVNIKLEKARIQFEGALDESVGYRLRYDAVDESLDYAYIRWFLDNGITLSMGRGWVAQGGTAYFSSSLPRYYLPNASIMNLPFDPYKEMIQLDYLNTAIGNFTLQVFEDKVKGGSLRAFDNASNLDASTAAALKAGKTQLEAALKSAGGDISKLPEDVQQKIKALQLLGMQEAGVARNYNQWNETGRTTTFALMYLTKVGGLKPMVQLGSYDFNHSNWYSVGAFYNFGPVSGLFNYYVDNRSNKITKDDGKNKDEVDTLSNIDLEFYYAVTDKITPYVFFSKFDRKEGGKEIKGNLPSAVRSSLPVEIEPWTDNQTTMAVGSNYELNKFLTAYLGYHSVSGDFLKFGTTGKVETEKLTQNTVRLGFFGQFK